MKVAIVTGSLSSSGAGVVAAAKGLSDALTQRNVDVAVFGPRNAKDIKQDLAWSAELMPVRSYGPAAVGYSPDLYSKLVRWAPDLVHAHGIWMHPSRSVYRWSRSSRMPYLVSVHGMLAPWALATSKAKKAIARSLYEDANLRAASCLHALTMHEASDFRNFGLTNPICIIPNGIAPANNDFPDCDPPWSGIVPANAKVMLFLGRLHPVKNVPALLRAWRKISVSGGCGNWHLVIAGWGEANYERLVRGEVFGKDGGDKVHFVGPLFGKDKHAALRSAHGFVLPSRAEALPMAILEAWAYGLPVLMTDSCHLEEGFLTQAAFRISETSEGMASALETFLCLDQENLNAMSVRAIQLSEKYQWSRICDSFLDVYSWLHNGGERPRSVESPL